MNTIEELYRIRQEEGLSQKICESLNKYEAEIIKASRHRADHRLRTAWAKYKAYLEALCDADILSDEGREDMEYEVYQMGMRLYKEAE